METNKIIQDYQIQTDLMSLKELCDLDEKFSFYRIRDCTREIKYKNSAFFKHCSNQLANNTNIRGKVSFKFSKDLDCRGMYLFVDKEIEFQGIISDLEQKYAAFNGQPLAAFEKIKFYDIPEEKRAQLLLSSINYINNENYQYTNDLWELLAISEKSKNKLVCNKFEFKKDDDLGLYLRSEVQTFIAYDEKYHLQEQIYAFDGQIISRYNGQENVEKFVKKGVPDKKQSISFVKFRIPTNNDILIKYLKTKTGALIDVVKTFNEVYKGIVHLEQKNIFSTCLESIHKRAKTSIEEGDKKLKEIIPKIYIDYDDSIRDYQDIAYLVKKAILAIDEDLYKDEDVVVQKGSSAFNDIPVLRIIGKAEIYAKEKIKDAYELVDKLNVQHLTTDIDKNTVLNPQEENELDINLIKNSMISLAIQMSVKDNKLDLIHDFKDFKGYTFFLPVLKIEEDSKENDKTSKKTRKKWFLNEIYFFSVDDKKCFSISMTELAKFTKINNELNLFDASTLYNLLAADEYEKNEDDNTTDVFERFTYGFIKPNKEIVLVKPTSIGSQVNFSEFDKLYYKIYNANLDKKDEVKVKGFRSKSVMYNIMPALLNSSYFKTEQHYYYYSAWWRKDLKENIKTRPILYKTDGANISELEMQNLIKLMDHPFSNNGKLSIVPLPIKILRTIDLQCKEK